MSDADYLLALAKFLGVFAAGFSTGMLWRFIRNMVQKITGVGT